MDAHHSKLTRRSFLRAVGVSAATGIALSSPAAASAARVRGAFVYPPTRGLGDAGRCSWPGTGFSAESHRPEYAARLHTFGHTLGIGIALDDGGLSTEADVMRFIGEVKADPPDGLLLIPFKRGHWPRLRRIVEEAQLPTIVLATLGTLAADQIDVLRAQPGAQLVRSLDDLERGMRIIAGRT